MMFESSVNQIEVKGNSYDLLGAIDRLPENTEAVVLIENSVTAPTLKFVIYPLIGQIKLGTLTDRIGATPKGCMTHYIPSIEQFRQYAEKVNQVRLRLFLDDEEV